MNRPPGQGFPYDQQHEAPFVEAPPFTRLEQEQIAGVRTECGYPLAGEGICHNTAPCPVHADLIRATRTFTDVQVKSGEPAKGLWETVTGDPLPGFAELRERYGDPAGLNPIPKYDPGSPVDLHDQLHADDQPWSVKTRLANTLGRRALATRLADALPPLLGAELADRLDTLLTQALSEQEAAITQQLSDRYHEARAALDADAAAKLKEVHDERYRKPSRLN